jgi:two-component system sensor histidine kinase PilS (NtrC family)
MFELELDQDLDQDKRSAAGSGSGVHRWRMLWYFFSYRLILSILLLTIFYSDISPTLLGYYNPNLFAIVAIGYFSAALASGIFLYLKHSDNQQNAYLMVFIDIIAITLIMHASGGVTTGLGMLLVVSIAFGSAVIKQRITLTFAAIASLSILAEQVYSQLYNIFPVSSYTHAGMLGASFFAIAILTDALSHRLQESEQLASQRGLDLANLEQLNDYVIQHMQAGVIVVDDQTCIRLMNDAAWHLLGMPDAKAGEPLEQASHTLNQQLQLWKQQRKYHPTFRPAPGGRELQAGFTGLGQQQQAGTMILIEDAGSVTQRAQEMKLTSLGRLTASIAHEIRNPLGAISHAEQLLQESPNIDAADRKLASIIRTNSGRVNAIIENVLQLSRRQPSRPEKVKLKECVEKFVSEFKAAHSIPESALRMQIQPEDTTVHVDPSQLRQILTNLCDNSIHHFDRAPEKLRIRIGGGVTLESGGPFLEIIDNGPGIKAEVARQMFEPFFTTRNVGSGLGLYIAKELGEANRLTMKHISPPMGGCGFRISFPTFSRTG